MPAGSSPLFARGSWPEARRIAALLRSETVGGVLLIVAAVAALVWANSPVSDSYFAVRDHTFGPEFLHLNLSIGTWAADGLLAIFFFVAGLELKREFVVGDLRQPRRAAIPISAAVGGMAVPALIYTLFNLGGDDTLAGWAIPTATDIAFSLAVLAVVSTHLPTAMRTFLLTLAIVDDLLAIMVIAVFYSDDLHLGWLALAVVPLAIFGVAVQLRFTAWWLLLPMAAAAWALVHASGIHATISAVVLGFLVPVVSSRAGTGRRGLPGLIDRFEHRWRPISAGLAVPVFAFFASGVAVGSASNLFSSLGHPVALGVIVGLVVGKTIGVLLGVRLSSWLTRTGLAEGYGWWDVLGLAVLAGMGFTVSLLIGELAFGAGSVHDDEAKIGVLVGSLLAALLAIVVLRLRNRVYRRICEDEERDSDSDGIPDVYETTTP